MTKILVSPGYGAGWSTWNYDGEEAVKFMLTYEPLIDAVENNVSKKEFTKTLEEFEKEYQEKFKTDHVYIRGAYELIIEEVDGPFLVEEYDGYESLITKDGTEFIEL